MNLYNIYKGKRKLLQTVKIVFFPCKTYQVKTQAKQTFDFDAGMDILCYPLVHCQYAIAGKQQMKLKRLGSKFVRNYFKEWNGTERKQNAN